MVYVCAYACIYVCVFTYEYIRNHISTYLYMRTCLYVIAYINLFYLHALIYAYLRIFYLYFHIRVHISSYFLTSVTLMFSNCYSLINRVFTDIVKQYALIGAKTVCNISNNKKNLKPKSRLCYI